MPNLIWLFRGLIGIVTLFHLAIPTLAQFPTHPPNRTLLQRPRQLDSLRHVTYQRQQQRTQDPALGRVPTERLAAVQRQLNQRTAPVGMPHHRRIGRTGQRSNESARASAEAGADVRWTERGPLGISGPIRTLLVDPLDTTRRKVWAGSSTAGLWVNNNIESPDSLWRCVSDGWENRVVSALAADSANPQVRYAATGVLLATEGETGGGLWKSSNGGKTWTQLPVTTPVNEGTYLQAAFLRVGKVVVGRGSVVFAASQNGLVRSADGGATWQLALAPQQSIGGQPVANGDDRLTDIEMGRDGLLYAATGTGRVFRSITTAGTSWTEVTPPSTAPYSSIRTELALGVSTTGGQQVLYAVSVAYDANYGGYTSRWLRGSTNGGATWQTMTPPTNASFPDDDFTLGFGDTYLTINVSPTNASTVYLSAYDQLYHSTDGGQTWSSGTFVDRATALLPMDNQRVVWGSDVSVRYAPQLSTLAAQGFTDAQQNRTNGFGGLVGVGVALRNVAGSQYRLVGGNGEPGLLEMPGPAGPTSGQVTYPGYPLQPYIDQDQSTLQIATLPGDGFLWRNTALTSNWTYASTTLATGNTALTDFSTYDSRSNTLYYWAGTYLRAVLPNAAGEPTFAVMTMSIPQPAVMRVGAAANSMFIATYEGKLYRIENTHQSNPSVIPIDGGRFPANSSISGIDVGNTNNELVVSLSNYGIRSIWYTPDGGGTWISKDETPNGLPDMPIHDIVSNPRNRRQVMLATELGVWASDNFTDPNPVWAFSSASAPLIRTSRLVYRPADGLVATVTNGRGIWETDAWATGTPTSPTLVAGTLSQTALCAGGTVPVPFTVVNGNGAAVQVRLSDAQGSFTNSIIVATGSSSPISVTLPATLAYGTRYRLRLDVPDLTLSAPVAATLAISDLAQLPVRITDRRNALDPRLRSVPFVDGYVCANDTATLLGTLPSRPISASSVFRWANDGVVVAGATSATLTTNRTGTYSFTVTEFGCQAVATNPFLLKVTDTPAPAVLNPAVAADRPDSGPICPGTPTPLFVNYLGNQAAYQWLRDGVVIPGATSGTLSATQTGVYTYNVLLGTCAASATPASVRFSPAILATPIAVLGDVAPTLCGTNTVRLYATQHPDSTGYQWLRDGLPMAGQTSSEVTINQAGSYALQVRRGACRAVGSPISVTTSAQLSTGFYYYGSTTVCTGEGLPLYAKRADQVVQWLRNGIDIPGATGLSYTAPTSGTYTLRATSGGCSGTAVAVAVVVSQTLAPRLVSSERCTTAELSTQDFPQTGTTQFSWFRNGQPIGQTSTPYRSVTESGTYSLSVSNGTCGGTSRPVSLSIGQPTPPQIQAGERLVRCANSAVELYLVSGPFTIWKRNGVAIANATTDRYVATEAGTYTLLYSEGGCTTESNALTVSFSEPASGTLAGRAQIRVGQSATLTVGLSGMAPWSFTLSNGQTVLGTSQTPYSVTVAPTSTTSYSLVSLLDGCGVGTVEGVARVAFGLADLSLSSWLSKRSVAVGGVITQTIRVTNNGPDAAERIVLVNRLPTGVSYATSGTTSTSATASTYNIATLAAGQSLTYSIGLRTNRSGAFANAVEVADCDLPDPDSQSGTGFYDGEDDATQADWRTTDSTRYVAFSPNPNGRVLPTVALNQPVPVANRADLSLSLWTSRRVARRNTDTVQVVVRVMNRGGIATSGVRASLTLPNGQFSTDGDNWFSAGGSVSLSTSLGQINANQTVTRTFYWIPSAPGSCWSQITASSIADPNSTPNNYVTRPGEDDGAVVDIRAL